MVSPSGKPLRYPEVLQRMGSTLRHRGPDSSGATVLPHATVGVNRLRIVDLDSHADQPFSDETHCVSVAVNGEIYNAAELRREFQRYPFRSRSDAEVVLPLYLEGGVDALQQLEGMFAIAIWDDGARRLILARDQAGEKPLFYALIHEEICFASEIQAILEHPAVTRELDPAALQDVLTFGYVREPRTMFRDIRKVEAGTAVIFNESVESHSIAHPPNPSTVQDGDAETELRDRLIRAVRRQLVADVPVGVFLSGGLDSSFITSIAARESAGTLKTFSVRFTEPSYDEGNSARAVSDHLGTDHVEVVADPTALARAFETIGTQVAEPIADPAILPTWLLATRAREHVGVVLGGEGADELFGGYPTYIGHKLARWLSWMRPLAGIIPSSNRSVSGSFLVRRFLESAHLPWDQRQIAWMGTGLAIETPNAQHPAPNTEVSAAMDFDYRTYLRDGLLPKIDRATMLVSLETRSPYLDRRVVEFARALPVDQKVRGLTTKWILKRAARGLLPETVIHRRKHGLSVPIGTLMNGALRAETDRLLDRDRLRRQGLLNGDTAGQLLQDLRKGNCHVARGVWTLLVLEKWLDEWT